MGTRGFLAPELLLGEAGSARADLYALGVVAAMALTGDQHRPSPDESGSWARRVLRRRAGSGPQPAGPRALWALVDRLLAPDPETRPTAQEVVKALDQLTAPASPLWWATFAAALTLLVASAGFWSYSRGALPEFSSSRQGRLVVLPIRNLTSSPGLTAEAEIVTTDLLEHVLRSFPQVRVVTGRGAGLEAPRAEVANLSDPALLRRLLARSGADLALVGEVREGPKGSKVLAIRVLDPKGRVRASREAPSRGDEYEPELAVPAVLQSLSRSVTPLGRPPDFPPLPSREAMEAYGQGLDLLRRGDALRALPLLERAAHLAPRHAPAVMRYAWALYTRGDARAQPTFMWARSTAQATADRYAEAESLIGLGLLARRGDRHSDEEVPLFQQAFRLAEATGDSDLQAAVEDHLGVHWTLRERWDLAEQSLQSARARTTATGNRALRASVLINLANRAKYLEEPTQARHLYQAAQEDAQASDNPLIQAVALNNLAILDMDEGRPLPAVRAISEVLNLRRGLGDVEGEHRALLLLGIAAYMQGDLDQAASRFEATLKGAREHDLVLIQGRALYRLGDVLRRRGQLTAASLRLMEALDCLRKKGPPQNQAEALATLAECKARQSDLRAAERLLSEARRLVVKDLPHMLRARAWVAHQQGQRKVALEALGAALALPQSADPEHRHELQALKLAWERPPR